MNMLQRVEARLKKAENELMSDRVQTNLSIAGEDSWAALDYDEHEEIIRIQSEIDLLNELLHEDSEQIERCPGCGCLPGDGITLTCNHRDGCGLWKEIEKDLIADAAEASEVFGDDELEDFAKKQKE